MGDGPVRLESNGETVGRLLLRPSEAATALGIGQSKCYELIASGDLPSIRIGSSVTLPLAALQGWIDEHMRK